MPGTYIFYFIDADTTWSQKDVDFDIIGISPDTSHTITLPDPYEGAQTLIKYRSTHAPAATLTFNYGGGPIFTLAPGAHCELFATADDVGDVDWEYTMPEGFRTFRFGADAADYTITNVTPDRAYDANATTTDELADVLGTLISDLIDKGLLQ